MAVKTIDPVSEFKSHPAYPRYIRWQDAERDLRRRRHDLSSARLQQAQFDGEAGKLKQQALEADEAVLEGGTFEVAQDLRRALATVEAKAKEAGQRVADAERALAEADSKAQRERAEVGDVAEQLGRHGHQLMERVQQRKAAGLREVSAADADEQALANAMIEVLENRAGLWFRRMMFGADRRGGGGAVGLESDPNSGLARWLKEARELGGYDV